MDFFRRHLAAVLGFPLGVIALMGLPAGLITVTGIPLPASTAWVFAWTSMLPLAGLAVALVAVHLILYRRSSGQRRAEWSVLAPVLVGGLSVGGHLLHLVVAPVQIALAPPGRNAWLMMLPLNALVLVGVCVLAAVLTGWLVARHPAEPHRATVWRDIVAVLLLIALFNVFRYAGVQAANFLLPPQTSPDGYLTIRPLAPVVEHGILLLGLVLAILVLAFLVYRGADRPSRAAAIALTGAWVGLDGVMAMSTFAWGMIDAFPPVVRQWIGVILYVTVSSLAVLYARVVVRRLWAAREAATALPLTKTDEA